LKFRYFEAMMERELEIVVRREVLRAGAIPHVRLGAIREFGHRRGSSSGACNG